MKNFKKVSVTALLPLAMSCKTSTEQSSLQDIGVINASKSEVGVVYEDKGTVYYKTCRPPMVPPNRDCVSDKDPQSMRLDEYIYKLPYDVGTLERTDQALGMITKAVDDARAAVTAGNQMAIETLKVIEPRKLNLEAILKIRNALSAQNRDLTFYEYNKEFEKITTPFVKADRDSQYNEYDDTYMGFPAGVTLTTTRSISIPANANSDRGLSSRQKLCVIVFESKPYARVLSPGVILTFSGKMDWQRYGDGSYYRLEMVSPKPSDVAEARCFNYYSEIDGLEGLLNGLRYYGNVQIPPPTVIGR